MSVLEIAQIDRALRKKGFNIENGDHHFYYYMNNGKKTGIFTKTSHSAKEIGEPLIKKMADQVRLPKEEFKRLIQCTLSGEDYKKFLKDKQLIQ